MKKLILSITILLSISFTSEAQQTSRAKAMIKKYCDGVYLMHQTIKKDSSEIKLVLTEGNIYGFYIINDGLYNKKMPELMIYNPENNHIERFNAYYNDKEFYRYIKFKASKSGVYTINVKFKENNKAFSVIAIFLQDEKYMKKDLFNTGSK